MKTHPFVWTLLLVPGLMAAQEPPPPEAPVEDPVPPGLAEVELERSRACVPALGRLAELDRDLQPLVGRAARIQALDRAILLEDSTEAAPFDGNDPLEAAVRDWFLEDGDLGREWAESQDTAVARQRDEARARIRQRIGEALEELDAQGQGRLSEAGDLQAALAPCEGAILVRSAVLEVCDTVESPVCAAVSDTATGTVRFVDAPEDVWDVVEFRPWTDPTPLRVLPDGSLGGGTTATRSRRGNVILSVGLGPMIRDRASLDPEEAARLQADLDSLDFTFEHPRLLFTPTLELQLDVAEPLGGETHFMLHFGDLSDPPDQVIWTGPVGGGGPVRASLQPTPRTLVRLAQGLSLSLTAVALGEDTGEGVQAEAVYSITLSNVFQDRAISALLQYMGGGPMEEDLRRLVPPDTTGGN